MALGTLYLRVYANNKESLSANVLEAVNCKCEHSHLVTSMKNGVFEVVKKNKRQLLDKFMHYFLFYTSGFPIGEQCIFQIFHLLHDSKLLQINSNEYVAF